MMSSLLKLTTINENANLKDFNIEFTNLKEKLTVFTQIKEGDKIMKSNDNYYLLETSFYQQTLRWWYSENRENSVQYLETEFKKFMNFLDRFLERFKHDKNTYKFLKKNIVEFINTCLLGLYNLKITYSNYIPMEVKVDSIILTLIDFKDSCDTSFLQIRERALSE